MGLLSMFSATALPWALAGWSWPPCCPVALLPTSLAGVPFPQLPPAGPQPGAACANMCCARCWRHAVHSGNFGSWSAKIRRQHQIALSDLLSPPSWAVLHVPTWSRFNSSNPLIPQHQATHLLLATTRFPVDARRGHRRCITCVFDRQSTTKITQSYRARAMVGVSAHLAHLHEAISTPTARHHAYSEIKFHRRRWQLTVDN